MDSALRRIRIAVGAGRLRGLPAEPGTPEITLLGAGESYVARRRRELRRLADRLR